jgi:hypothetical protein
VQPFASDFKGQTAAAAVLTECDMEGLGDINRKLRLAGPTRTRMHL